MKVLFIGHGQLFIEESQHRFSNKLLSIDYWYNSRPVSRGISLVAKTKYVRFISRYVPSYAWPFANEATPEIWLDSLQNIKNVVTHKQNKAKKDVHTLRVTCTCIPIV